MVLMSHLSEEAFRAIASRRRRTRRKSAPGRESEEGGRIVEMSNRKGSVAARRTRLRLCGYVEYAASSDRCVRCRSGVLFAVKAWMMPLKPRSEVSIRCRRLHFIETSRSTGSTSEDGRISSSRCSEGDATDSRFRSQLRLTVQPRCGRNRPIA